MQPMQRKVLGSRSSARWLSEPRTVAPRPRALALYALHSGQMYGTERMALATLEELAPVCRGAILTPPGPVTRAALDRGLAVYEVERALDIPRHLRAILAQEPRVVFFATGVKHSLGFALANAWARRSVQHYHVVHGGTDERESYGRKHLVQHLQAQLVAVSEFVRERLAANGADPERVLVCENFLAERQRQAIPRRQPGAGLRRVVVVSRLDPIKRVDVLLTALERHPALQQLSFDVYGAGQDFDVLQQRATKLANVRLHGFRDDVTRAYAEADLLLHLCPEEPFGLVVLEAMAAGLPVLVPDRGGAAGLVEAGRSGDHFRADDADDLAQRLLELAERPVAQHDAVVAAADARFQERYSAAAGGAALRELVARGWNV